MNNAQVYTIDDFGNMLNQNNEYVGYYDTQEKACILFSGGQIPCPQGMTEPKHQAVIQESRTFYWVVLVAFILFVILGAYLFMNRKQAA